MSDHKPTISLKGKPQRQEQDEARVLVEVRGGIGQTFKCVKGKIHKEAVLVEIKKRGVRLKRDHNAQDSFSVGIKDFAEFWKLA